MNILFLGGTGFFGISFLKFLEFSYRGEINSLTIVGRNISKLKDSYHLKELNFKINFIKVDILGKLDSLKNKNYTHIIHAAADSTKIDNLNSSQRYDQIVGGTKNVLDLLKNEYPFAKLIYISSGAVYGEMPEGISEFTEESYKAENFLETDSTYAQSKRLAEGLCLDYYKNYGLKISIARCFAFSGEDLPKSVHFAIGNFAKNIIESKPITIKGDGRSVRSYLDQTDLAEWLMIILKKDKFDLSIYNIGSERSISIFDLAVLIKKISNKNIDIKVENSRDKIYKKTIYVPSILKIKSVLKVKEKVTLEESIKKMISA